jgi:hypothetical protein
LHTVADPHKEPAVRPRRRAPFGLLVFILAVIALAGAIIYPPTFLFAVRQALGIEAWRYGFRLSIGSMDGGVTKPIWLSHVRLSHTSGSGASSLLDIDSARTSFAWQHLVWRRDQRVWTDLTLDGVRGIIDLQMNSGSPATDTSSPFRIPGASRPPRLLLPTSLTISHATVAIHQSDGYVLLEDTELHASDIEAGHLVIGALSVHEPWMTGLFSNCRGSLLIQDSQLILANMKLADSLSITSASADLPGLLRGQLQMQFALDAFSGKVQGELTNAAPDHEFDSSGTFSNISVAQLAAFFGQDADGSITEGKFTFHGSPHHLEKTTFTTYFQAGNFRWGARRWNSLVAGATYVDHRLLIPNFELRQAHNSLTLKGNMDVPGDWKQWWKTDFNFQVAAKIDNLSELSALLGPEFGDIFGQLTVDGDVSGENASFNGQLIASGSHLSFGKAPLDQLQAAIKLQGNEIQVTNAEFTHGNDFLRAQGVVNILGAKRYWGEVKASIADLSLYASFLQPPIAPEAFSGGLALDWSGDGAPSAHSGAFTVRLNRIQPLVSGTEAWQPIDLTAEATYSPDSIFFSNLVFGNGQTALSSRVVANPSSLTFQDLKLQHGKSLWLAGDAQIPLNVWAAWLNPGAAPWWNFESPCKLDLKFDRLSLRDTLLLSGREQPYDGELTGALKSDGTLAKLTTAGHLSIKNAAGAFRAGALKSGGATLDFQGDQVNVTSAAGQWNNLAWTASGAVTAPDVRSPSFDMNVKVSGAPLPMAPGIDGSVSADVNAAGPPGALVLSGSAQLQTVTVHHAVSIADLLAAGGTGLQGQLPALTLSGPAAWKLDIAVGGSVPIQFDNAFGTIAPALEITGSIAHPSLAGKIDLSGFTITDASGQLTISSGSFFLNPGTPAAGTPLILTASGNLSGEEVDGSIFGTLMDKHISWAAPLSNNFEAPALFPAQEPSATPAHP